MLHSELPIPYTSRYKAAILFTIKIGITYTVVYWTISSTPALPGKFPERIQEMKLITLHQSPVSINADLRISTSL